MHENSYFPIQHLLRASNPLAYLLQKQREDGLPGRNVAIHMRHFVSIAPSNAKLRDGTYHQLHNDTAVTLKEASDDFTTL